MNVKAMLATSPLSVIKAIEGFNRDLRDHPELVKRLGTARAFYTHETDGNARLFGFSKSVRYERMSARRYLDKDVYALLDGGRTERHLFQWFDRIGPDTAGYQELYHQLEEWMVQYGKRPRSGKHPRNRVRINVLKPKFHALASSQEISEGTYDLDLDKSHIEGKLFPAFTTSQERNPAARRACIEIHGASCVVCGFNFEEAFGARGKGFIHVHHLTPLSESEGPRAVDPAEDLRPVCPNCHYMLHRDEELLSPEELKSILRRQPSSGPERRATRHKLASSRR